MKKNVFCSSVFSKWKTSYNEKTENLSEGSFIEKNFLNSMMVKIQRYLKNPYLPEITGKASLLLMI